MDIKSRWTKDVQIYNIFTRSKNTGHSVAGQETFHTVHVGMI
jgi:hypothetical protein